MVAPSLVLISSPDAPSFDHHHLTPSSILTPLPPDLSVQRASIISNASTVNSIYSMYTARRGSSPDFIVQQVASSSRSPSPSIPKDSDATIAVPHSSSGGSRQLSPMPSLTALSSGPSENEDPDSFQVRHTYAQLDQFGVKGDGFDEGIELTRARNGVHSTFDLPESIVEVGVKHRELSPREVQLLSSLDRYGFYVVPTHERVLLLHTKSKSSKTRGRSKSFAATTKHSQASFLPSLPPVEINSKEASRIAKWEHMLEIERRDQGGNAETWTVKASKAKKFRERIYKGIPDRWRRASWLLLINKYTHKLTQENLRLLQDEYMMALAAPSTYDIQIDLDVPRTINGHVLFRTRYGLGQRCLFHVLHSFSLRCATCGYCQGMGSIAATLLCYFEPELTYTLLVQMHDSYGMHDVFAPGFPGLLEAIYVQERVMERLMPSVYAALKQKMISTTSYATKWYITLFANTVPFQTQLRLWDVFLLEGRDLLVVASVAIVWFLKDNLTAKAADFEVILSLLSSLFVPQDEDVFMSWIQKCMDDAKLREDIRRWREHWKGLVQRGQDGTALL